ncbi:MAG: IPT/TIG domain-containing protein, partial [Anaerolineae bacterium]
SNRISCPTPSGVCANLYRFVGNDPGTPGRLNPNFNPNFRTIAAPFEALPGLLVPADLAPTQVGVTVQLPGGQVNSASVCALEATAPQLFAVDRPYVTPQNSAFTITGVGFGATAGTVTLDGVPLQIGAWADTQIAVTVPGSVAGGPHQLTIATSALTETINGLTIHVLKGAYDPVLYEVGPGMPYSTIQSAIDTAAARPPNQKALIVVYPGVPDPTNPRFNPRGAYYENLLMYVPVKLQGVGPGGVYADGTFVPGSIVDGVAFGGDTALATAWRTQVAGLTWDGNQTIYEAQTIYVLAQDGQFAPCNNNGCRPPAFAAAIDGFDIRGGDQMGFPANINEIGGGPTGLPPNVVNQGGAIFVNAYARYLQITNNVIENNSGAYGTVRIGTPNLPAPNTSQHNENVRIAHNRIIANGGTNLAGGIGLFAGSDGYEVAYNDICGNFSAEYGGGISHYGLSPYGSIHHNRVYFNRSYDEGGGIIIAGALPADPTMLSPGSGPVNIYANVIQANLGNDDGGGIRFLM